MVETSAFEFYEGLTAVEPREQRNQGATIWTQDPERVAVVSVTSGQPDVSYTYRQLIKAIVGRAASLQSVLSADAVQSGASPLRGTRVGLLGKNSVGWLVDFYALQLLGVVPVPLSYKYPVAALTHVLRDADIATVISDDSSRGLVDSLFADGSDGLDLRVLPLFDFASTEECDETRLPSVVELPSEHDIAMVLYTSGSTGNPKGVALSHTSHVWVLDVVAVPRVETYAVEVAAPLYHMNALARSQKAFAGGETIVLLTEFSVGEYVRAIGDHKVKEVTGVPPMFALLEPHLAGPEATTSSVIHVNMASAPAGDSLFAAMSGAFPNAVVTIGYGTTESGPVAFYPPTDVEVPVGSVGYPHPDVTSRLIDPATGLERDDYGVLEIRTGALFSEYLNIDASKTPMTADGFYHTKDLFRVENGFYFFAGREDDMFNSGAENVYPAAVEKVLLEHPSIKEAVVVPVPDPVKTWKPVAFVTLTDSAARSGSQLINDEWEAQVKHHSLQQLEPYAHPRRVWVLDSMPLAATNKVDRALLARWAAERV